MVFSPGGPWVANPSSPSASLTGGYEQPGRFLSGGARHEGDMDARLTLPEMRAQRPATRTGRNVGVSAVPGPERRGAVGRPRTAAEAAARRGPTATRARSERQAAAGAQAGARSGRQTLTTPSRGAMFEHVNIPEEIFFLTGRPAGIRPWAPAPNTWIGDFDG